MVQQAPPEVGTVLDGYRFKGGDPAQESSWEQVAPIPAPEYGPGAQRLPNGAVVRYGPRGGMDTIVSAAQASTGDKGSALVGAEARARFMINLGPLQESQRILEGMDAEGYDPSSLRNIGASALEAVPFDGGFAARVAGGGDYNAYNQAAKTFEAAILPIMSGAAVTPTEAQRMIRAALPQPGDTPEVLAQKARQRRQMINAVASGIGEAPPYDMDAPDAPEAAGGGPLSISDGPAGGGIRPGQGVPPDIAARFGQDGRVSTEEMLAAGWTPDYESGQWLPPGGSAGGGSPPPVGPQGGPAPQGGAPQSQGYQTALEQERANADRVSKAGGGYDMTSALTGEFNDELAYGAGFVRQGLGNIGRRLAGRDIEVSAAERGRAARDVMSQDRQEFARERPVQNALGNVLGGAAFGPTGAARSMVGRMAQGGGIGATYGFAGAEGGVMDRLPEAAGGAAIGAVAVPVVERAVAPAVNALARPVVEGAQSAGRFLGRQAGGAGNALGIPGSQRVVAANQPNPLASGLNRFADRMGPERVNALSPSLATARNNGLNEADLIDILDDGSIGRMRALGTRDTPGRDVAVQAAERRRRNLPSRVSRIASEEISQDSRPALQAIEELGQTRRANASAIDTFANDTVPIDPNLTGAMQSDLVRATLRDAARRAQSAVDPMERQAAERLTAIAEGRASMTGLSVREAQDISRALDQSATAAFRTGSPDGPVLRDLSKAIRQSARDNSPGYDAWLKQYGDDSDLIEAAATGRNFVSVSRDPANARGTEAFVSRGQGASPPEQAVMRTAAREAVEAAASNPSGARTVLEGFANDTGQARRAAAIGADPRRLQERAGAELDSVTRHQRASPRIGSETATNQHDGLEAAGSVIGAVGDVFTGQFGRAGARVVNMVKGRGFSNQEAEAIVMAANDPAQTDQLVSMLAQRMSRRDAHSLARAIRYQVTTSLPTNQ